MLVACVAPGWSLSKEQIALLAPGRCHVLAVSNACERLPHVDTVYAADRRWWRSYYGAVKQVAPRAQLWSQNKAACDEFGLNYAKLVREPGLSPRAHEVHCGDNGGYQALNLALHLGATRALLVGYDCRPEPITGRQHCFGEYPEGSGMKVRCAFDLWREAFKTLKPVEHGMEIINCTPGSAIKHLPRADLKQFLGA